jgi:hypothetical protein
MQQPAEYIVQSVLLKQEKSGMGTLLKTGIRNELITSMQKLLQGWGSNHNKEMRIMNAAAK